MILSNLSDEHLSQVLDTWLSINLILLFGWGNWFIFMEIEPYILFLRSWMFEQISLSFICFFVGILTSNDILIEVPKLY